MSHHFLWPIELSEDRYRFHDCLKEEAMGFLSQCFSTKYWRNLQNVSSVIHPDLLAAPTKPVDLRNLPAEKQTRRNAVFHCVSSTD